MIELKPEDEGLRELVNKDLERARKRHKAYEKKWERYYAMYRSYLELRRTYRGSPRDRDDAVRDAQRQWGAELFIPYCFMVIETVLPRMLSGNMKVNVVPGDPDSEENVDHVKLMLERQADQIDYDLRSQDVAKSGLMYGLGVQKTYWRTRFREQPVLEKASPLIAGQPEWITGKMTKKKVFDDPWAEQVDIWDFFWDPDATDIDESCDYLIHRTWRSDLYVRRMVESGLWRQDYPLEDLLAMGPATSRDDERNTRDRVSGLDEQVPNKQHEVWEYHDGKKIITLLDGQVPVLKDGSADNPFWHGEEPFQAYRPTKVPNEFVGIGEIEPIEHLQQEMNTLRSQRRDNAALVLQRSFAYFEGMVDPDHLKFGPGMAIPVNGDPRQLLFPIDVGDIPNSGYQEEAHIQEDIARTTGIDDGQAGIANQAANAQTATGAQLVQAAANVRIQQKARLFAMQVIKPMVRQWLAMDQQKIRETRQLPGPPTVADGPDARWGWYAIGPAELAGEFAVEPEGESLQPENVPQQRQDGQELWGAFAGHPEIDQQKLAVTVLEKFGVKNAQTWIKQPPAPPQQGPPPVLTATLNLLVQGLASEGMDPQRAQQMVMGAFAHAQDATAQQDQQGQGPQPGGNGNGGPPQGQQGPQDASQQGPPQQQAPPQGQPQPAGQ